jgi:GT2 family glycosyltransferase
VTPEISVCIVHWNTPDDLRTCLDALLSSTSAANLELVVIDNASLPDAVDAIHRDYPNITLIKNTTNVGYAAGCNQAARIAKGEMLLFLNPDARVEPAAIATLVMSIKTHPMTLAAPRLVWPDGRTQPAITGVPDPMATFLEMSMLSRLHPRLDRWKQRWFDYEKEQPAVQPMASCWLVPRVAWDVIGEMDEAFPLYFNDVDWALRASQAGWHFRYIPNAVVVHDHGGTTRSIKKDAIWESRRAFACFWKKHYKAHPLRPLMSVLLWVEACLRTRQVRTPVWQSRSPLFPTDRIASQ